MREPILQINDLYKEIRKNQKEWKVVWLYEKRAWWETVFLYNIQISDLITFNDLQMLNNPLVWNSK